MPDPQDNSDATSPNQSPTQTKPNPKLVIFGTAGAAIGVSAMLAGNSAYGFPPVPGGALGGMLGGAIGGGIGHLIGKVILGIDSTVASEPDDPQLQEETVELPYAKRILMGFIIFWLVVFFVIFPIAALIDYLN